jgi:two-component system response regulator RpaA
MKTILVVEDDRRLARLVELNLTAAGYNIVVYHDGDGALAYLQTNCPDLVLLDLMLPTVTGWDLLQYIQEVERLAQIPILAISALAQPEEQQRTLATGATAYLVKPFGINQLFNSVESLLGSPNET